ARGSTLMEIFGVGPAGAARILADVGDVARFADRNRFASWTGTAPLDASSGGQIRHRYSRAGNRRMNHVVHVAAIVQIRHDTEGRAYYRRKLEAGKTPMEALRCSSAGSPTSSTASSSRTPEHNNSVTGRTREGTAGRLKNPARPTCPRTSTLRISHFPDPHNRRYNRPRTTGRPTPQGCSRQPLDTEGCQIRASEQTGGRRAVGITSSGSGARQRARRTREERG
ncbi:MAG: family transposase, partial [Marmoricola sp.]|nr:family transposase [Marmoricola sp.]